MTRLPERSGVGCGAIPQVCAPVEGLPPCSRARSRRSDTPRRLAQVCRYEITWRVTAMGSVSICIFQRPIGPGCQLGAQPLLSQVPAQLGLRGVRVTLAQASEGQLFHGDGHLPQQSQLAPGRGLAHQLDQDPPGFGVRVRGRRGEMGLCAIYHDACLLVQQEIWTSSYHLAAAARRIWGTKCSGSCGRAANRSQLSSRRTCIVSPTWPPFARQNAQ